MTDLIIPLLDASEVCPHQRKNTSNSSGEVYKDLPLRVKLECMLRKYKFKYVSISYAFLSLHFVQFPGKHYNSLTLIQSSFVSLKELLCLVH